MEAWRAAWPLLLAHGLLLAVWDLGARPRLTVAVLALAFAAWLWAVRRMVRSESFDRAGTVLGVLVMAGLLRVVWLPLPPTLSDDILRYAWDGKVVRAGLDPYALAPEAEELAALRDERWQVMPHHEVPTVYPPLALATFAAGGLAPDWIGPLWGIKILLTIADLLGCLLLVRLAARLGLPRARALLYAWNPLVCLEVAGMGHVDALMSALVVATVYFLVKGRCLPAGLFAAGAVLAKIVPLVALPVWFHAARTRRGLFAVVALSVLVLGVLPVATGVGMPPGLLIYGVQWEFNGPIYEPLHRGIDATPAVQWIKSGLDHIRDSTGEHEFWSRFYPYVYPEMLAKLLLLAGLGMFVARELLRPWGRPDDPSTLLAARTGRLFAALVLAMATVYPWYVLMVLPWAALFRHRAWLLASGLQVLAYLPQHIDGLEVFPWMWLLIWGPVFALLVRERWVGSESKASRQDAGGPSGCPHSPMETHPGTAGFQPAVDPKADAGPS